MSTFLHDLRYDIHILTKKPAHPCEPSWQPCVANRLRVSRARFQTRAVRKPEV